MSSDYYLQVIIILTSSNCFYILQYFQYCSSCSQKMFLQKLFKHIVLKRLFFSYWVTSYISTGLCLPFFSNPDFSPFEVFYCHVQIDLNFYFHMKTNFIQIRIFLHFSYMLKLKLYKRLNVFVIKIAIRYFNPRRMGKRVEKASQRGTS